ncbi:MAG: alpha/beta hydrolase [Gammaproteobacteria bacterium]
MTLVVTWLSGCTTNQLLGAANFVEGPGPRPTELAYGDGNRQRLDVYRPAAAGEPRPVVVFVHGGSWRSGDKTLYRWLGKSLAGEGFVAVLVNYGLMPTVRFPDSAHDVAAAVAFVRAHAAEWGGDPSRLTLMGHSAGAHLAALVTYDGRYLARHGLEPALIQGFVGLSGPYDFLLDTPLLRSTFAGPPERERDAQPVNFANAAAPRSLLVMGRDDTTVNPRNTESLGRRLREVGAPVEELWVAGDHGVTVGAFSRLYRGRSPIHARVVAFARGQ